MSSNERYEKILLPIAIVQNQRGIFARAECQCCSRQEDWRLTIKSPPPEVVKKHFTNKGWRLHKGVICPDCIETRPKSKTAEPVLQQPAQIDVETPLADAAATVIAESTIAPSIETPAKLTPTIEVPMSAPNITPIKQDRTMPTPAARELRRLAIAEVEIAYDDKHQRYKPGYTDASIAKEVGVSESVVAKIREEFFGPHNPPSEIEILKLELAEMRRENTALAERIKKTEEQLSNVCRQNGWAA